MFRRKSKTGNPLFNLEISLKISQTDFDYRILPSGAKLGILENYGLAIRFAREYLEGTKYVTNKGNLINGIRPELETRKALLDISDCMPGLIALRDALGEERSELPPFTGVHFHYKGGSPEYIKADRNGLYLEDIRRHFEMVKAI